MKATETILNIIGMMGRKPHPIGRGLCLGSGPIFSNILFDLLRRLTLDQKRAVLPRLVDLGELVRTYRLSDVAEYATWVKIAIKEEEERRLSDEGD